MSLPRMSWHIGDYRKDTGHLRAVHHGAYFLLCMHYWAKGGLPDDDSQLAAIACMSDKEWLKIRPIIEAFFLPGWKHKRIEWEMAEAKKKYDARAAAGKKGGEAKAQNSSGDGPANGKQKPSNARALPAEIPSTPDNPTPKPSANKKDTAAIAAAMALKFNEFSEAFPRRQGANPMEPAAKKFGKLVLAGVDPDLIVAAARRYAIEAANIEPQYVAQAITWLKEARYKDYPEKSPVRSVELDGFYADDGSPELDAWDAHYRLTRGINAPRDSKFGWRFPTRFPPEAA